MARWIGFSVGTGSFGSSLKGDGFQRHVTDTLDGPFIVLFEQDRADKADDGVFVGEDSRLNRLP